MDFDLLLRLSRSFVDQNLFDQNWRRQRIELIWVDYNNTFDSGKPEPAITSLPSGRLITAVGLAGIHSIRHTVRNTIDRVDAAFRKIIQLLTADAIDSA